MQTDFSGLKTIDQFCRDNAVSRATAYREIAAKRLVAVKVGAATRIKPEHEKAWLNSLPVMGAAA